MNIPQEEGISIARNAIYGQFSQATISVILERTLYSNGICQSLPDIMGKKKTLKLAYHTSLTWRRWINQTKWSHISPLVGHWGCLCHLWLAITSCTFEKNSKLLWWPRKQKLSKYSVEFYVSLLRRKRTSFFFSARRSLLSEKLKISDKNVTIFPLVWLKK